jgi:ribonuclease-3
MEFRMQNQEKDQESGSPVFKFQVFMEGIAGESGQGYSKKEAQQLASEATLKRLKREPQFIDAIFGAKSDRTKMEEMPTMAVPTTEQEQDFLNHQEPEPAAQDMVETEEVQDNKPDTDEFDLSDISATPQEKTREDIIAEAEAAAFAAAE